MARNEQLIRQHRILQILERTRFGQTVEEVRDALVEELGLQSLHERSVTRDLKALQKAGIDVDCHATQRGRVWRGKAYPAAHTKPHANWPHGWAIPTGKTGCCN